LPQSAALCSVSARSAPDPVITAATPLDAAITVLATSDWMM
jgi:hypothetical protein